MSADLFSLEGRRALVTGASRGLGAAIAVGLSEAGAKVGLVARDEAGLYATMSHIAGEAAVIPADLANLDEINQLVDRSEEQLGGAIDVVVHAAGIQHREPAESFDRAIWQRILDVNLSAPFFLSQEIGRRQLESGRSGSHILIGSLTSRLAMPSIAAYTASKSGVFGVVRSLGLEWASRGVRVNGIGPGYIRTDLTKALIDDPERGQKLLDRIPMGRLGDPEDMVGAVVFLASDASSYVTGQLLMIDGGWTAN